MVVAYHAGVPGFSGGFVGVDVFFVISGFLITRILLDDARKHGTIDLGDFYARRIRRILPALMVVVLFTMAAMPLVSFTTEQVELASSSAVAAILFYSNVFFWTQSESYFAPQLDLHPLLHTWSLAIEEQFYMVWPLALSALTLAAKRFKWDLVQVAIWFFAVVLSSSLAFSVWTTAHQPIAAFYLMPSRAWELATGALLVVNAPRLHALTESTRTALRVIGLIGIGASALLFSEATAFPGVAAILPVLSTALVIASVEGAARGGRQPFITWRPVVFVGLLSYSWYLWHWPLLSLKRLYFLGERSLVPDLLLCAIAFGLAYLTHRYVETPVRTMRFKVLAQKRWTFAFGAGLCLAGLVGAQTAVIASTANAPSRLAEAAADKPPLERKCNQTGAGGLQGFPATDAECAAGAPGAPVGIVVWGDSHANHLMPMVGQSLQTHAITALQRTRAGCPPLLTAAPAAHQRVESDCAKFNAAVVADLAARQGLQGVVLSSRWSAYLADPSSNPRETFVRALTRIDPQTGTPRDPAPTLGVWPHDKAGSAETLQQSLQETFAYLQQLGVAVIVVAPTPTFPFSVPACLARRAEQVCTVERRVVDAQRGAALVAIRAAAGGFPHVTIWDPIERLCNSQTCFVASDGIVIYSDDDHFTATWSRRLAADFAPVMSRFVR